MKIEDRRAARQPTRYRIVAMGIRHPHWWDQVGPVGAMTSTSLVLLGLAVLWLTQHGR